MAPQIPKLGIRILLLITFLFVLEGQCSSIAGERVPHEEKWGIYALDISTEDVHLIYSSPERISGLQINCTGDTFAFSQRFGGDDTDDEEICIMSVDGTNYKRLTNNTVLDTYPVWSPDGSLIAFLSWREETMDIYTMDSDGSNVKKMYDSGFHDGDIHWLNNTIVFTRNSQIWMMNDDGTGAHQVTDPPRAGEWGKAVLPFGDYDPRLNPDGTVIAFERMVDDESPHGNYDIYTINVDGSHETGVTATGYTQGLPKWSHKGDTILYEVAAAGETGVFELYVMNADGSNSYSITPEYFPDNFLCHSPVFSPDDSIVYFVGEWWEQETGYSFVLVVSGFFLALMMKKMTTGRGSQRSQT